MSNLGFLRVYELLNMEEDVVAERIFFDKDLPFLRSVESNRHILEFDVVLFSISFELSYINIGKILSLARIPIFSHERKEEPLILAGGIACQINPEPISEIVDGFLIGDFEEIVHGFTQFLSEKFEKGKNKITLLEELLEFCKGVYVPCLFEKDQKVEPAFQKKTISTLAHSAIVSNRASFSNTFLIEITRGCGRGCRFCAAGFVYRPPRPWPIDAIEKTLKDIKGAKKVGLIGLEYASHNKIMFLCKTLMEQGIGLGFSSLRADAINEEFVELMIRSKNFTATIAPEAGSEALRNRINKNINEEQILKATSILAKGGIRNLKLYFMIGLPFEKTEDIAALINLVKKIQRQFVNFSKSKGRLGEIIVSVSTFVPKPWTPFQWSGFQTISQIEKKRRLLKEEIKKLANVTLRLDSINEAMAQAILGRADRKDGSLIISAYAKGKNLKKLIKKKQINADNYFRNRGAKEEFPWEVVAHRVKKDFLLSQFNKANRLEQSPFCTLKNCKRCGACE